MSHETGTPDDVYDLIETIGIGMLVTSRQGADMLRARPMAASVKREENAIFFLTDAEGRKDDEVRDDPKVCLAFADPKGQRYVSVSGTARISNDHARIKELWSVGAQAFWDTPDDQAIRVVEVRPTEAEFWQGPGRIVSAVKMAVAAATGGRPDLGTNAKVGMR